MGLAHDLQGPADGRPVLLLHSMGMDRSVWDEVRARLDPALRVIACDLPGHGRSPRAAEMTVEGMALEVAGLLREVRSGPAVVVGLSLGACVGQVMAVRHRDVVAGLGLLGTTCWYGPDGALRWKERAQLARERGLGSLADVQLARWFTPGFAERRPEVGRRLLGVLAANDIDSYEATCLALGAFDFREQAARIDVPTAVLVGEQDATTPPASAMDLHERVAGSTLTIVPECSHLSPLEQPGAVTELVADLLDRAAAGDSSVIQGEGVGQGPA